jgi:hypothetical protein
MHVVLIHEYLIGLAGLVAGAAACLVLARVANHHERLPAHDARLTAPLLLAAGVAHLFLIPAVELERQLMFGLYGLAAVATVLVGLLGFRIWRVGAVLVPAGSILAYAYFAALVHQADYAGLTIKLVEALAIASALWPLLSARTSGRAVRAAGG